MQVEKYLKQYQPVIYKTFVNELENDHLSHAYLLVGNPGTPLFETAKYLAKSILCDDPSPLACDTCITCLRIDDGNYPDFIVVNGEEGMIKKEDVTNIQNMFSKQPFESKGIQVYIIHLVENMNPQSVNAILKFLEEPHPNIYAFLTTNNEDNILPTIVSRCQVFHLKALNRSFVINDAINLGVDPEDAQFLSYFYNEPELIMDIINDEAKYEEYLVAKNGLLTFLDKYVIDDREAIYYAQKTLVPSLKNKESLRFFIDMLSQVLEDVVALKNNKEIVLSSRIELISSLEKKMIDPASILIEVLKDRGVINLNVNTSLLLDHMVLYIVGGK